MMKDRRIISYSVIRFRPYPELGEFVNVGIVALCHTSCEFDFILSAQHRGRVNNFFQELSKDYFTKVVAGAVDSLKALKKSELAGDFLYVKEAMNLFRQFTAPIESVLFYEKPSVRVVFTDFKTALNALFDELILRQEKSSKQYQEIKMAKELKISLSSHKKLKNLLFEERLGDSRGVYLPLTCTNKQKKRGIRVLDLNKPDPNKIISTAGKILETVDMLKDTTQFEDILIAIYPPKKNSDKFEQVYRHVMKKFEAEPKILHCKFSEKSNILQYALTI